MVLRFGHATEEERFKPTAKTTPRFCPDAALGTTRVLYVLRRRKDSFGITSFIYP